MMQRLYFIFLFCGMCGPLMAQVLPTNGTLVAAGFLTISPDAVAGSLGNAGTGGGSNVFSLYHNAAKYAFTEEEGGVAVFYNPWGTAYAKHLSLSGVTGFWRSRMNTFAAGFRYFAYGEMEMIDEDAVVLSQVKPYELAVDFAYTLQLSPHWAGGVGFRYIRSYLGHLAQEQSGQNSKGVGAYAFDVSFFYRGSRDMSGGGRLHWGAGLQAGNIGSRLKYGSGREGYFLPAALKVGISGGVAYSYHRITFYGDLTKSLVPPEDAADSRKSTAERSVFYSMGKSFDRFSMKEICPSVGLEYIFRDLIALRCGYNYEDPSRGNQQFVAFGCGGRWHHFQVDFAYLCYTGQVTALDNMLKISCQYGF